MKSGVPGISACACVSFLVTLLLGYASVHRINSARYCFHSNGSPPLLWPCVPALSSKSTGRPRFTRYISVSIAATSVLLMKSSSALTAITRARTLSRFGSGL